MRVEERFGVFPVMAPSDAPDPHVRALLDALDGGARTGATDDAAAALGENPDPAVTALLREHLRRATCEVGPTELTLAMREGIPEAEVAAAEAKVALLHPSIAARAALVRRTARALAMRRDDAGWRDLAALATTHPSRALRLEAARALLGVFDLASDERRPHGPVEHLAGLTDALSLPDTDAWTVALRGCAAEAVMVVDPARARERLAPFLEGDPQRPAHEETVRSIARAWFVRMRPADDPGLARALAERMTDRGTIPATLGNLLKERRHPAVVDGALAALARADATAPSASYLFRLLGALGDRRAALPIAHAVTTFGARPILASALAALEALDDATVCEVLAPFAAMRKGQKVRDADLRKLLQRLGRKRSGVVKAALPEAVAPGLPVWFEPPPLDPPATGDAALDALLVELPGDDAAKALARRTDDATAWAVCARFVEAAEGVCDYTWDEAVVAGLPTPVRARARRAHLALYGAINQRLTLLRSLVVDLARRHDPACDGAVDAALTGLRYAEARALVARAAVGADASRGLCQALASRFDTDDHPDVLLAAAEAAVALGDDEALARIGPSLGSKRRAQAHAAAGALARRLTSRSDRRWTPLLVADLRVEPFPFSIFAALGALRDPSAVDAVGEATVRMAADGASAVEGVRALYQLGDPRGAAYVLQVLEDPRTTTWLREIAEVLRKLGGPSLLPRVRALRERMTVEREASRAREPEALDALLDAWR